MSGKSIANLLKINWWIVLFLAIIGSCVLNIPIRKDIHLFPFRIALLFFLWFLSTYIFYTGKFYISVRIKNYLLFLVVWLSWAILSFVWAQSKFDAIRHIVFLSFGIFIIFFSIYCFHKEKDIKSLFYFWISMTILLIGIGIFENLTMIHLPSSGITEKCGYFGLMKRVPTAVFRNPNDYATFLCLTFPFLYGFAKYIKNHSLKFIGFMLLGISLYLIVSTRSRANIIALFIEIIVIFLLLSKTSKVKFVLIAGTIFLCLLILPQIRNFYHLMISQITSLKYLGPSSIRVNLIKNGWSFLVNSAFLGVGAGNVEWYMANKAIYETFGDLNIHNWWMEILVNYGVIIFTLYVVFYINILVNLFAILRNTKNNWIKIVAEICFISLIGFPLSSISSSSIMAIKPIWLLFATALCVVNCYRLQNNVS
ncbi:O-antigen ligase family protein [candidate division WOR-3 bacterium]|nr:O-antigen ligase family protein [candidate division WOR-3 bacterium]